ncbi:MAG TPA: LemA family protein [Thermodesulfobacteriota bacterium]|nr:LemA family protein [Thermodesulfobacteriota bacterium]
MKKALITLAIIAVIIFIIGGWAVGVRNNLVASEENVNQTWAQVQNVYQRRYDLIPNLVETVKGYAAQERETFIAVTEARSKVGQINISADDLEDAEKFRQFQQAQSELGSALSRLLVVAENYPQLKSNENFLQLQSQLEGTENRIAVERRRFNEAAQAYNTTLRKFPENVVAGFFGFEKRPYFEAQAESQTAPRVRFR